MVAGWIEAKNLAVQGMRQPSHGMPVSGVKGRERPLHCVPAEAGLYLGISQNIDGVIKIGELVMSNRIIESKRGRHQQEAADDDALFAESGHEMGGNENDRWEEATALAQPHRVARRSLPRPILARCLGS